MGTNSQTPFLWGAGSSNNGLLQNALQLLSSSSSYESGFSALASASIVISSVSGSSGVFNNSLTGEADLGDIVFTSGGAFTPAAGGNLAGWFLKSLDGGTTFEYASTTCTPARSPDFVIPLIVAAYAANQQAWSAGTHGLIVPAYPFKVCLQNNSGAALPTTSSTPYNTLRLVSPTLDY